MFLSSVLLSAGVEADGHRTDSPFFFVVVSSLLLLKAIFQRGNGLPSSWQMRNRYVIMTFKGNGHAKWKLLLRTRAEIRFFFCSFDVYLIAV